jgi:hypothetical protein
VACSQRSSARAPGAASSADLEHRQRIAVRQGIACPPDDGQVICWGSHRYGILDVPNFPARLGDGSRWSLGRTAVLWQHRLRGARRSATASDQRSDDGDPANLRLHKRDDIDGVSLHLGLEPTA